MKRYIIAGCGNRAIEMFIKPVITQYNKESIIAAVYDINLKRAEYVSSLIPYKVKVYSDLDRMLDEIKADICIVATVDYFHEEVISKAMEKSLSILCEKPIAVTADQCNKLLELDRRNKNKILVTHNSRYMPINRKLKNVIYSNVIGEIYHINYNWNLDLNHGAEYFRRWHGDKKLSGGLMVHKSVHHFDLINWWLQDEPVEVTANASLLYYGNHKRKHGSRCSECQSPCFLQMTEQKRSELKPLYFDNEGADGYIRDKCIYDEGIDSFDTMDVLVKYKKGTSLSYSLVTYAPELSWELTISGQLGVIKVDYLQSQPEYIIHMIPNNSAKPAKQYTIPSDLMNKHNGADKRLQEVLLSDGNKEEVPELHAGITAAAIGICANVSAESRQTVVIKDFIDL